MNDSIRRVAALWVARLAYATPPGGVVYIGVFFDPMSRQRVLKRYGQAHPDLFLHHMTVWHFYDGLDTMPPVERLPWGRDVQVKVVGHVQDGRAQALILDPPTMLRPAGRTPHVTVSTASGVPPAASNDLIQKLWRGERETGAPAIKGKLGWWGDDNKVHFTRPSV